MKIKKQSWHDLKLSVFWIAIFTMIIATGAIWFLWSENARIASRLGICQKNFTVWSDQVESGRIVIELEGGVKGK